MKTMTLTASSYADLKPFEMLAKKIGLSVLMSDVKPSALESYRLLAKESRVAAKGAGLVREDVGIAIRAVRARKKNARIMGAGAP